MMYITSKGHTVVAGFVPRDARFRELDWGVVCNFSIKADEERVGGDEKPQAKWTTVSTKGELARYARSIVQGDNVLAFGKMTQRSYAGNDGTEKTVKELKCEFLMIQPKGIECEPFAAASSDFVEAADDSTDDDVPF